MRFSCEGCSAKYMISDDKVGPGGVKVRCKKCGHVTLVRRGEPESVAAGPGGLARRRVVGGHRRAAGGPGRDRRDPAPLGPGRDRAGEPGLVLRAPRVGAHLVGTRAARPPRWRHAGGGSGNGPPAAASALPPHRSPTTSGAPGAASALAALDEPEPRPPRFADPYPPAEAVAPEDARPAAPPPPPRVTVVGTDPTGVVPLPMAGLERTGERRISTTPWAPGAEAPAASSGAPGRAARSPWCSWWRWRSWPCWPPASGG